MPATCHEGNVNVGDVALRIKVWAAVQLALESKAHGRVQAVCPVEQSFRSQLQSPSIGHMEDLPRIDNLALLFRVPCERWHRTRI